MVQWTHLMAAVCTLTAVAASPVYQAAGDRDTKHSPLIDTSLQQVGENKFVLNAHRSKLIFVSQITNVLAVNICFYL